MKNNEYLFPERIENLVFKKELSFSSSLSGYVFAEYVNKKTGKLYFAKAYFGAKYDRLYKSLLNEVNVYTSIVNKNSKKVKIPKLYKIVNLEKGIIAIFEYIDSAKFPKNVSIKVYNEAIRYLRSIHLNKSTRNKLRNYNLPFFLFSYIYALICWVLSGKTNRHLLVSLSKIFFSGMLAASHKKFDSLIHRDLRGSFAINSNNIFLFDWQLGVISHKYLELAQLMMSTWVNGKFELDITKLDLYKEATSSDRELRILKALLSYVLIIEMCFVRTKSSRDEITFGKYISKLQGKYKKKIVFSTFDSLHNSSYGGGGAIAINETAKRLVGKYDVLVLTSRHKGSQKKKIDGISYKYIGTNIYPLIDQGLFHLVSLWYSFILSYELWLENFTPPCITGLIPLFHKNQVIGLAHMMPGEDMMRKYHLPFHLVDKFGIKQYSKIIATSDSYKKIINRYTPQSEVIKIPNGSKRNEYKRIQGDYFIWIGRLEVNQKGLDLLLEAYSMLEKNEHPLMIIGSGSKVEEKKFNDLIDKFDLHTSILRKNKLPNDILNKYLSRSLAAVVSSRFETFSMSALDAVNSKTPLITFDIEGLRWIPKSTRYVAKQMNPESLTTAMRQVLNDPKKANKIASVAYQKIQPLTWDQVAEKYDSVISEALYE